MVADPNELYKRRVTAARQAAHERVTNDLGPPSTPEEQQRFDAEVERLVAQWTEGWEGPAPIGFDPLSLFRRWRRRRSR